jgi:hypothetical protein
MPKRSTTLTTTYPEYSADALVADPPPRRKARTLRPFAPMIRMGKALPPTTLSIRNLNASAGTRNIARPSSPKPPL